MKRVIYFNSCFIKYKSIYFFSISELLKSLPNLVSPTVAINRLIAIPSKSILYLKPDGQLFELQPPICHIGPASLNVRLIAKTKCEGMVEACLLYFKLFY